MFRFKFVVVILLLISCGSPKGTNPVNPNKTDCTRVINKTDSILSYADDKMIQIKQNKINQQLFVDSLQHTIEVEQNIINNLNKKFQIKEIASTNNLESIDTLKQQLEEALNLCLKKEQLLKNKEKNLREQIKYYNNREIKLITIYNNKIDSLEYVIDSILVDQIIKIDNIINDKKKNKRKNRKG